MREPSPQLNTQRFKEVKETLPDLEDILEYEFGDPSSKEEIFREFFFILDDGFSMLQHEVEDFILIYKHLAKRVILSLSANDPKLYEKLAIYQKSIEPLLKNKNYKQKNLADIDTLEILPHDIAHAVGNILNGRFSKERKLYPLFTEEKPWLREPNKQMMEDELYSSLFAFSTMAISIETQKDCASFEEYTQSYISRVMALTIGSIEKDLGSSSSPNEIRNRRLLEKAEEIADDIARNPPADVIEALKYIWDHRDNPRVLVDLFFKEVGPYIEDLKKRTPRKLK